MVIKFKKKIINIIDRLRDHRTKKYISYKEAIDNFFQTYKSKRIQYQLNEVIRKRQSDTIFILGSGPSLDSLTKMQIDHIDQEDSFGVAYSFVKKEIIPTYQMIVSEDKRGIDYWIKLFSPYREIYKDVIVLLSSKQKQRLMYPHLMPELFPNNTKYCSFQQPAAIQLTSNRPFEDKDFDKTLLYRNIMSLILDLVVKMEYKKIVLLGVDLDKWEFFYEKNRPEMKEYVKEMLHDHRPDMKKGMKFDTMYPKGNKYHSFDAYLYALSDYLKRKRNITLYIGKKDNSLFPGLPAYFD